MKVLPKGQVFKQFRQLTTGLFDESGAIGMLFSKNLPGNFYSLEKSRKF